MAEVNSSTALSLPIPAPTRLCRRRRRSNRGRSDGSRRHYRARTASRRFWAGTRESPAFDSLRRTMGALGSAVESPLLTEARFRESRRSLCAVYADNSAMHLGASRRADRDAVQYAVYAYVLARVLGIFVLPETGTSLEWQVATDAIVIKAMEKLGPALLKGFRASIKIPALRTRLEKSAGIRCSTVPLTISAGAAIDYNPQVDGPRPFGVLRTTFRSLHFRVQPATCPYRTRESGLVSRNGPWIRHALLVLSGTRKLAGSSGGSLPAPQTQMLGRMILQ